MAFYILAISVAVLSWAVIGLYRQILQRRRQLELPSERGMHNQPLVTGAGLVPVFLILAFWLAGPAALSKTTSAVALAGALLAAVSWIDDTRGLPVAPRLITHVLAVSFCLALLSPEQRLVPWMPLLAERGLEALAWVWFINLFNFMDGIDGLAASEAVTIALGCAAILWLRGTDEASFALAVLIVAAMLGYLVWNWHPARVLMGDAGSVPLGFLTGWLLLDLALRGDVAAACILPLYFVADSTLTLVRRLSSGQMPHHPHRQHMYQRAALACGSHARVVREVIAANSVLVLLALLSRSAPTAALGLAGAVVLALLARLAHLEGQGRGSA